MKYLYLVKSTFTTLIKADLSFLATVIRVAVKERRQQFINPSLWAHSEKGR